MNNMQQQFLQSNCYVTDDFGFLNDARQRGLNILCLVEPEESNQYPGCSIASLLLPHPVIVVEFLNSDPNQMNYNMIINKYLHDYQNYLASSELEGAVVNILASLYKTPKHLLIFCPTDQNKTFKILDSIAYFFSNTFGIIPGDYRYIYSNDPNVSPKFIDTPAFRYILLDLLFVNGFIDIREYANKIPLNSIPSPRAAAKLLQLVNQPIGDLKSAIITAINIIESIKMETQTGKISPFIETRQNVSSEMENQINNMVYNSNQQFQQQPINPPPTQQYIPSTNFLRDTTPTIISNENQLNTSPTPIMQEPYIPSQNLETVNSQQPPINSSQQGHIVVTPPARY